MLSLGSLVWASARMCIACTYVPTENSLWWKTKVSRCDGISFRSKCSSLSRAEVTTTTKKGDDQKAVWCLETANHALCLPNLQLSTVLHAVLSSESYWALVNTKPSECSVAKKLSRTVQLSSFCSSLFAHQEAQLFNVELLAEKKQ